MFPSLQVLKEMKEKKETEEQLEKTQKNSKNEDFYFRGFGEKTRNGNVLLEFFEIF